MVAKKDGRREKFERQKVLDGLLRGVPEAAGFRAASWSSWWMRLRRS
jgi:hypothetical protein